MANKFVQSVLNRTQIRKKKTLTIKLLRFDLSLGAWDFTWQLQVLPLWSIQLILVLPLFLLLRFSLSFQLNLSYILYLKLKLVGHDMWTHPVLDVRQVDFSGHSRSVVSPFFPALCRFLILFFLILQSLGLVLKDKTLKFWLGWPRNAATSSIREDRSVIVFFIDGCLAEQLVMLSNPVTSSDKNNSPSPKTNVINDAAPKTHYKRVSFCAPMLAQPVFFLGLLLLIDYYGGSLKEKRDLPNRKTSPQSLGCTNPAAFKLSDKLFFTVPNFFFRLFDGNIGQQCSGGLVPC